MRAFLLMFVVFMLAPVVETILPSAGEYIEKSFFGQFFSDSNFLLTLIPGT